MKRSLFYLLPILILLGSCAGSNTLKRTGFSPSDAKADSLISMLPDFRSEIEAVKGSGRAIVSEPNNSDRVSIQFTATDSLSLLTIRNRIGIEGGKMLVDADSILIYNRIDKVAQKISVYRAGQTSLNELATVNILDLLNYVPDSSASYTLFENKTAYLMLADTGTEIFIRKEENKITEVSHPSNAGYPYSRIIYEGYSEVDDYIFPRKITIFSSDQKSRVAFLIQRLTVNPEEMNLVLEIPDDIIIQRI